MISAEGVINSDSFCFTKEKIMANKNFSDYNNLTTLFTSLGQKKNAVENNIAPVESDASESSRAYEVGEQLILEDVLYTVIDDIAVGDALVVDTNIEASDNVTKQIKGTKYTAGEGITIDEQQAINSDIVMFSGTKEEWMALPLAEKKKYTHASWIGDAQSGIVDDTPTQGSNHLVTSGGVYDAIQSGGGGGAGSLIAVTTNETTLFGKQVSVTDGVRVWQGTFDDSGNAEVTGVTSIGELSITATDGTDIADAKIYIKNYSKYEASLSFYTLYGFKVDSTKATDNVSYEVDYNGENVLNYSYDSAYMDFTNDKWIWGSWTGDEFFMPRPVLISQDYSDKIYLNPNNLTLDEDDLDVTAILTGTTDGYNAMMEWGRNGKKIWYKLVPETDDATYTCYVCDKQLDSDFHAWSFYDAEDNLIDHFYTSIYNGSTVSSVLRSLSGKTPNNTTAGATQITQAKANNKNGETYAWYIDVFADRILINLLMMLVIKSTNSDVIGYGNYSGGSSASSLIQSGLGNTKGMFYGKQSNSVCKVFGMENYFANCWRRMAGLILSSGAQLYKLTYGTADGSSDAGYIESDNAPTNYLNAGKNIATNLSSSYITKESALSNGALIASAFAGANATYYSDACWSSTGVRFALVGDGKKEFINKE